MLAYTGAWDRVEGAFWESLWPRMRDAGWAADLRASGAGFAPPRAGAAPLSCVAVRHSPRRQAA